MVRIIALILGTIVLFMGTVWAEEQPKPDEDKLIQIASADLLLLGLGKSKAGGNTWFVKLPSSNDKMLMPSSLDKVKLPGH